MKKLNELYEKQEQIKEQIRIFEWKAAEEIEKKGAKRINLRRFQWAGHYEEKNDYTLANEYRVGFLASSGDNRMLQYLEELGVKHEVVTAIHIKKDRDVHLLVIG